MTTPNGAEPEPFVGFITALAGGGNGAMAWYVRKMPNAMIALMQDNVALAMEALEAETQHRARLVATTCETCEATSENCSAHISDCPVYQAKKAAGVTS